MFLFQRHKDLRHKDSHLTKSAVGPLCFREAPEIMCAGRMTYCENGGQCTFCFLKFRVVLLHHTKVDCIRLANVSLLK